MRCLRRGLTATVLQSAEWSRKRRKTESRPVVVAVARERFITVSRLISPIFAQKRRAGSALLAETRKGQVVKAGVDRARNSNRS